MHAHNWRWQDLIWAGQWIWWAGPVMEGLTVFCIKAAYQRVAVRPAEIILNGFVIQASPLVLFIVAWWGRKRRSQEVFHTSEPSSITWTHCWCSSAPQGSWWTPGELPACGSAAPQPPSSDAGWNVGSRNPGTYPNLARIAPCLKASERAVGGLALEGFAALMSQAWKAWKAWLSQCLLQAHSPVWQKSPS